MAGGEVCGAGTPDWSDVPEGMITEVRDKNGTLLELVVVPIVNQVVEPES